MLSPPLPLPSPNPHPQPTRTTHTQQVPEFRVSMAIGTDKLDALYRKLKPKGVTMTALLSKACGLALAGHPLLYAQCTPDGSGVTYNERVNIAMAVAMPDGGLITPVLKDADSTDIYTMSRSWADLVSVWVVCVGGGRVRWGVGCACRAPGQTW